MPMRYRFIRVADNGIEAEIERSDGLIGTILRKLTGGQADLKPFTETMCKELYEDANRGYQGIHTPTSETKNEMLKAYHQIRTSKERLHIPFDT
jgi:hypothetical protein